MSPSHKREKVGDRPPTERERERERESNRPTQHLTCSCCVCFWPLPARTSACSVVPTAATQRRAATLAGADECPQNGPRSSLGGGRSHPQLLRTSNAAPAAGRGKRPRGRGREGRPAAAGEARRQRPRKALEPGGGQGVLLPSHEGDAFVSVGVLSVCCRRDVRLRQLRVSCLDFRAKYRNLEVPTHSSARIQWPSVSNVCCSGVFTVCSRDATAGFSVAHYCASRICGYVWWVFAGCPVAEVKQAGVHAEQMTGRFSHPHHEIF